MHEMLTMLGEARAHVNIFSVGPDPSAATASSYAAAYARYFANGSFGGGGAVKRSTDVWRRAALRHGAMAQLRAALPEFERALAGTDADALGAASSRVDRALEILRRHPAGKPGRRPRPRQSSATLPIPPSTDRNPA